MKAFLTVGVSASGKSTWAKEHANKTKAIITNRDDLRFSLTGCSGWGDYKFNKDIENTVTALQHTTIRSAASLKKDIIIADTNLNETFRKVLVDLCVAQGFEVVIKEFPVSLEEAWKRDSLRGNGVGRDVIFKQYQQWMKYIGRKQYVPDESLPKAVMFDIDGTLAHMNGRGPFEWDKVGSDTLDGHVATLVDAYRENGFKIIILSGRDGVCKESTIKWLTENEVWYDEFFMREAGDCRKDTIIKEEIFWRDVAPKYNVRAVVDDRPCVVRMWQELNIPKVIAVGNQSIEF